MPEETAVKLALLERTAEDQDRRLLVIEKAVQSLGELATALKTLRWLLIFFVAAWPALIYVASRP